MPEATHIPNYHAKQKYQIMGAEAVPLTNSNFNINEAKKEEKLTIGLNIVSISIERSGDDKKKCAKHQFTCGQCMCCCCCALVFASINQLQLDKLFTPLILVSFNKSIVSPILRSLTSQ